MRIIKCDFCGEEIEEGGKKDINPADTGWCTLDGGSKMFGKTGRDICPRCIPKETEDKKE